MNVPVRSTHTRERPKTWHDTAISVLQVLGKPIRDVTFWSKACHIYGSYKFMQTRRLLMGLPKAPIEYDADEDIWQIVHETNSQRMIDLCLRLRGFYLKTGQFLGTRHDFMPRHYTTKLSKLHDDVPPMDANDVRKIIEAELCGPIEKYFSSLDLSSPIGSASIAQVHAGVWRQSGEKVAVKVQFPHAERIMVGDLKNLRVLAEYLLRTEFKFDLLSSIKELQKQIVNEFDFESEAQNMDYVRSKMLDKCPEIVIPRSIFSTRRVLVMSFLEGQNLCRLAELRDEGKQMSSWAKKRIGRKIVDTMAKAWGEMIFELRYFNADPHPGNICLGPKHIGLLDWGQVKRVTDADALKFSEMVLAIESGKQERILKAMENMGIKMSNPSDKKTCEAMALSILDTKIIPGFNMDPFDPNSPLKDNTISQMPSEMYFLIRTVQLMRGITFAFGIDYSVCSKWAPYARKTIASVKSIDL